MRTLLFLLGCLLVTGCEGYYRITDPGTNQVYYTKGWLQGMYGRCGQIQFRDLHTGDLITLPSSKAAMVSEAEAAAPTSRPTN